VPTVFLFAPDDANALVVLPGTKYFMHGRGAEAALLIGAGSLCALIGLVLVSPLLDEALRPLRAIIQPHLAWILVAIIAFMLLGEWPRANDLAPTRMRRWLSAWAYLGAGLLTFTLSGLLGFVLMYSSPIPVESGFQNLLPAFVGLFAIPGLIQLIFFSARPPRQTHTLVFETHPLLLTRGALTGLAGGLFASLLPVVTGGIGGLLAGHATAQRDDRLFMISQGASKIAYYVGSLMLLFVPGLTLTRGGMAWMLSSTYVPYGWHSYWLAVAAVALCGALAFAFLIIATHAAARLVNQINVKWIAVIALLIAAGLTLMFTGWGGIVIMLVATTIGLIPVIVGGRRLNCLGVLLVPITLNVIGVGPQVAQWLGLL
jgi:putative membrane protein